MLLETRLLSKIITFIQVDHVGSEEANSYKALIPDVIIVVTLLVSQVRPVGAVLELYLKY